MARQENAVSVRLRHEAFLRIGAGPYGSVLALAMPVRELWSCCTTGRSNRCSRVPAATVPQQNQEEKRASRNEVRIPPWDEVRDVLNNLIVRVLHHVGAEKLLEYPNHGVATRLRNVVNIYRTFTEMT